MARLIILLFLLPLTVYAFSPKEEVKDYVGANKRVFVALEPTRVLATSTMTITEKIVRVLGPEFIPILTCESDLKQFKDGKPLISKTSDAGVAQINQVHWERAKSLGLDIFNSEDDNLAMAKIIYTEQGLRAWNCYEKIS